MITPIPPSHEVDPGAPDKVPASVRDEEAFLDALVDRDDTDEADLEELHHKVAEAYTDEGGEVRSTEHEESTGTTARSSPEGTMNQASGSFAQSIQA